MQKAELELNKEKEADLSQKTEAINKAFEKERSSLVTESVTIEERDKQIEEILATIPRKELQDEAREIISIIKESNRDEKTKVLLCERACKHILLSYMDNREYLSMPNREFIEYKIYRFISGELEKKFLSPDDLHKVARINFDLNGLKVMNDVGGHGKGNIGLLIFSEILKNGETTKWLKQQKIEVAPSAEGGDEFGLIIHGDTDLRPILPEIEKRYFEEVKKTRKIEVLKATGGIDKTTGKRKISLKKATYEVDKIIEFDNPDENKKLREMGIINDTDKKLPEGFKFQLGTSVGSSTFGEALSVIDVEGITSYRDMVQRVINQMFKMTDRRAIIHKDKTKKQLEAENPTLSRIFNRVSPEVVELNKKILELSKKVEELTSLNIEERRRREEAEELIIELKTELLRKEMEENESKQ